MAWERRTPDLMIGIPHMGTVTMDWALSFRNLNVDRPYLYSFDRGQPIDASRNSIVQRALDAGVTWLFFLDSDTHCPPGGLIQLLNRKLPIVSALYNRRHVPMNPCAWKLAPNPQPGGKYLPIAHNSWPKGALIECVSSDTLVQLATGNVLHADEIKQGDLLKSAFIARERGLKKYSKLKGDRCTGVRVSEGSLYRLKTWTTEVDATPNHLFYVRKKGQVPRRGILSGWLPLSQIEVGDKVLVAKRVKITPKKNSAIKVNLNAKSPHVSVRTTFKGKTLPLLAQCAGFYLGDGTQYGRWAVRLCEPTKDAKTIYKRLFHRAFGVKPIDLNERGFVVGSRAVILVFDKIGIMKKSPERTMPEWVCEATNNIVARFIRGYFDADGWVTISKSGNRTTRRVGFVSTNKELIQKLKMLLLRFGILSSHVTEKKIKGKPIKTHRKINGISRHNAYELCIYGSYIKQFARQIGSDDPAKKSKLKYLLSVPNKHDTFSEGFVNRSANIKPVNDDFNFEKVRAITPLHNSLVIDISTFKSVTGLHPHGSRTFLANGIVVHNCDVAGCGACLVHTEVFRKIKQLPDEYFYDTKSKPWFEWTLGKTPLGTCVLPNQEVFGSHSEVQNVAVGDLVMGGGGNLDVVTSTFSKDYLGEIIEIIPTSIRLPVKVTPEHNVLTLSNVQRSSKFNYDKKTKRTTYVRRVTDFSKSEEKWVKAGELKKGDYVAFPVPSEQKKIATIHLHDCEDPRTHLPHDVDVTPELLEMFGFYVAEGSSCKGDIKFSFGIHERKFCEKMEKVLRTSLKINPRVELGDHALITTVKCRPLAKTLLEWFGKGANNKTIPEWIQILPVEDLKHFIRGLWLGDGYATYCGAGKYKHKILGLNTSSKKLQVQLFSLLLRLGVKPSMRRYKQHINAFGKEFYVVKVQGNDAKKLTEELTLPYEIDSRKMIVNKTFFFNGKLWTRISKINKIPYEGKVYDLTVKPNNSYVLEGIIVHNSEDFAFFERVKAAGFQVLVDTNVFCKHDAELVVVEDGRLEGHGV